MNRKLTPWLLLAVAFLGVTAWWTQRARQAQSSSTESKGDRVLAIESNALTKVRVRQDYWNSFVLLRRRDGSWDLVEPSVEPANPDSVNRLLSALANLPALKTLDTPADDSERYRQYGLWNPALTVTLSIGQQEQTLIFGREAEDGSGSYCSVKGRDDVYVTSAEAVRTLSSGLDAYRQSAGTTPGGASTTAPAPGVHPMSPGQAGRPE
jgi:hypothetical protein